MMIRLSFNDDAPLGLNAREVEAVMRGRERGGARIRTRSGTIYEVKQTWQEVMDALGGVLI
jgi:hypothetical protein